MIEHRHRRGFGFHDERHFEIIFVRQARLDKAGVGDLNINTGFAQIGIHTFGQRHIGGF